MGEENDAGWEGAPKGLLVVLGAAKGLAGALFLGAKELNELLGVSKGELGFIAVSKGFFGAGNGVLVNESRWSSSGSSVNLTCFLCMGVGMCPPPRALVVEAFWPLCSRFAAFWSRSSSNGFGGSFDNGVPIGLCFE